MVYGAARFARGTVKARRLLALPGLCAGLVAPCALAVLAGEPAWVPGIPLLFLGLVLVYLDAFWALCFIAFSIMPFCVVQQEIASVTLNLPEVLILLLAAREGVRMLFRREVLAPRLPLFPLLFFVAALVAALATGFLRQNGAVAVLQDFRQFSEFVVLFWLVLQCVRTREQAQAIAFCFVLGAGLIAAHGIVQQFTYTGISAKQIASDFVLHQGVRSGSFYGATALGGMMVLACGPAIGVLLTSRQRWVQALVVLCIVLCLLAAVFTKTRGSWIGLLVAIIFIGISVRPSRRILIGAAALAAVFALLLGPLIAHRIATLADPAKDQSLMDRAQYYAAAYQIGRAHPILGLGWGCYYDISEILKNEGYIRVPRPDAATLAAKAEEEGSAEATVHSAYLQLFVKTGALGVAGFFMVVLAWLERIWRARSAGRGGGGEGWVLYAGITASLAGYLFHSTFENFFQWPVMAQSFWLLMGLSFALVPAESGAPRYRVPVAGLAIGGVIFALFMYACIRLERLHTDNYEQNVARALNEGDIAKALLIAQRATDVKLEDPMVKTVYGRVLLKAGQIDAGLSELRQGAGALVKAGAPVNQDTGWAYYFAPARLSLGNHFFEHGDVVEALAQFELARVGTDLCDEAFAEFHPVLYEAYARRGRWDRAVDFGLPNDEALAALPGWSLVQMGHALADRQQWASLARITGALAVRGEFASETACLQARANLAQSDPAGAVQVLSQLPSDHQSAYFLGAALEAAGRTTEAVAAYRALPEGSLLRGMALARASALVQDPALQQELRAQLKGALAPMQPISTAVAGPLRLVAFGRDTADITRGGRFPLVLLWEGEKKVSVTKAVAGEDNQVSVALANTNQVLQLQWVENQANWASVERAYPGDAALPGWIDTARDWFQLRSTPGFTVEHAEDGDTILSMGSLSWIYSAAIPTHGGETWLLLGRLRDPEGNARLGWQIVDGENNVVASAKRVPPISSEGWVPQAECVVAGEKAAGLRISIETIRSGKAPTLLDDIAAIKISPPAVVQP